MVSTTPSTQRSPFQRHSTFISTPTAAAATSALDSFSIDPILSPFLSDSFSPASFSSAALSSGSPASTAEHLHHAIRLLESQLRSEVLSRHSDLLTQLSSLRHAHAALSTVRSAVSSLHSSVRRARSEISDPHAAVLSKSSQLSNLHLTADLLHHAVRALRLSRKLRDLAESKLDLAKAAQIYADILRMCAEHDLAGIHAVDEELAWVRQIGEQLRGEAIGVLERGMEGLNQAEVGTGLQVFYNLGELKETVEQVVGKYKGSGVKSVGAALDMKAISGTGGGGFGPGGIRGGATPQIGGGARAREALWQRMGSCLDQMHSIVVAVWHLQRVLSKKRDPFTHVLLLDEVLKEDDALLTTRVWEAIVKAFMSQMKSAFSASSFVKEIFTSGYPKLFSMIENLLERISRDTEVKGVLPAISLDGKEQMVEAIKIFQTSFLAQCLGRLSDIVNNVFPVSIRGSVPSKEQVSRIISRIQEELEAVKFNGHLTLLVLREIGKALLLLAQRAEYQISAGHEARQVTGPATPAQVKNFALCQHLQEIHIRVSSMVVGLPAIAAEVLSPPLGALYGVACDAVTPVFKAMIDQLESCILQIHEQNFGAIGADASMDYNSSPYMEELQKSIIHFQKDFLSKLLPSANTAVAGTETICTQLLRDMATRTLMLFIRHASLVRPLSESGKLRMARDMAELELTVGQHLFPVEQLGAPYRALRAFRPLIFLDTSQLGTSPLLQDLPPSIILHHLYSRSPDELQSPIQRNKLTPVQYSLWLDSQGEDQIWKGIKATLDDYAARVGSRGDKEFSPVYPLMLQLGSSLSENASAPKKR